MEGEETRALEVPTEPCPHCDARDFILWDGPAKDQKAFTCQGCGAVISSTHPLDPDDRPRRVF
jgi:hypothetical protein